MTALELRSSFTLAGVFGLRMLGLFIILPVFALYAETLPGGRDHTLVGIALGAYGLTQAVLQIPFGWLSDRWGRKPTIYLGLFLFALGSVVAASATSIGWVIAGRVLQGAGAISAAVIALASDLTRDEVRTKAMAIIGITIGVTFALSMVLGPVLGRWIGVPGIFALTGVLALGAIAVVRFRVPDPAPVVVAAADRPRFADVLRDPQLARLNVGIFVLHAVLMALFVVVPFALRGAGLEGNEHWKVYLPVMLGAFVLMAPVMAMSERRGRQKTAFVGAVALLAIAEVILSTMGASVLAIAGALLVFFTAFNLLEASLPSLISKIAPAEAKGTAVGVYSSIQFLGTFVGAATGGWLSQHHGAPAVFHFCGALTLVWFGVALGMNVPVLRTLQVPPMDAGRADGLLRRLQKLPGVREVRLAPAEGVARLKVDRANFDEEIAMKLIHGER
jgi:MFS family permease